MNAPLERKAESFANTDVTPAFSAKVSNTLFFLRVVATAVVPVYSSTGPGAT